MGEELDSGSPLWLNMVVSAHDVMEQIEALPAVEQTEVLKKTMVRLCPGNAKAIERLLRRLENPDIPEDVWRGIEDAEDGRLVPMETAMSGKPPWVK